MDKVALYQVEVPGEFLCFTKIFNLLIFYLCCTCFKQMMSPSCHCHSRYAWP